MVCWKTPAIWSNWYQPPLHKQAGQGRRWWQAEVNYLLFFTRPPTKCCKSSATKIICHNSSVRENINKLSALLKRTSGRAVPGCPVVFTSCFPGRSVPAELPVSSIFSVLTVFIKSWYKHIQMAFKTLLRVLLIWKWKESDSWFQFNMRDICAITCITAFKIPRRLCTKLYMVFMLIAVCVCVFYSVDCQKKRALASQFTLHKGEWKATVRKEYWIFMELCMGN